MKQEGDDLRRERERKSAVSRVDAREAARRSEAMKMEIIEINKRIAALGEEKAMAERVNEIMLVIRDIIDPTVPIGRDDRDNVERRRFLEPRVPISGSLSYRHYRASRRD